MKALNRAIARTVSQLARYGREGGHVPMLMALENHLDALLTMERKQLEQDGMKVASIGAGAVDVFASNLSALQQQLAEKATPPQPQANDNAPPAPDVINMNDPRNWLAGDVVKRKQYPKSPNFTAYREYTVAENDGRYIRIKGNDGTLVSYPLHIIHDEEASSFFAWIRHGDSEVAA